MSDSQTNQGSSRKISEFFGIQGTFQIIVAVVTFVTASYTFYVSFLEGPRLQFFLGDRIGVVSGTRSLHVRGSLVNQAVKAGTIHLLEAQLTTPSGDTFVYDWDRFFDYIPGTLDVQPAGNVMPVSVPGKASQRIMVQFTLPDKDPEWIPGRYELKVSGWVNRPNRHSSPNLTTIGHFSLSNDNAKQLAKPLAPGQGPTVSDFRFEEWER